MGNYRILFQEHEPVDNYNPQIETFCNNRNTITIRIENTCDINDFNVISLDKHTAIKFAKTLRTEINKIED